MNGIILHIQYSLENSLEVVFLHFVIQTFSPSVKKKKKIRMHIFLSGIDLKREGFSLL